MFRQIFVYIFRFLDIEYWFCPCIMYLSFLSWLDFTPCDFQLTLMNIYIYILPVDLSSNKMITLKMIISIQFNLLKFGIGMCDSIAF